MTTTEEIMKRARTRHLANELTTCKEFANAEISVDEGGTEIRNMYLQMALTAHIAKISQEFHPHDPRALDEFNKEEYMKIVDEVTEHALQRVKEAFKKMAS